MVILRKIISICMLILLLTSFCPFAKPIVEVGASSTFIVTDGTPDYVAIENPYYICNLTSFGAISRFYIKPHTDLNIVSHTTGFRALGGHEENNWYNATYGRSAGQWIGYSVESCTHSIVKQTSDYVTVKTVVDFGGYNEATARWYLEMGLVSYRTFYAEKPYYKVTYSKIFQEDLACPWNPQTCFLFDFEWWDHTSCDNATWTLNATGGVIHGKNIGFDVKWNCAPHYGKLPWYLITNTTLGNSYGIILLDAFPVPGEVAMGAEGGGTYSEFQIDHNWGGESVNAPDCVSYLAIANATDDYQYIDQLATNFWLDLDPIVIDNNEVFLATRANERPDNNWNYATSGRTLLSGMAKAGTYGPCFPVSGCRNIGRKFNASGNYQLYGFENLEIDVNKYNSSYASQSFWGDFENELRWNHTFEYCCDSDTVKYTYSVESLKPVNITDLKVSHYAYLRSGNTFESEPNLIKYNRSLANFYADEGWFIKNVTHPRVEDNEWWSSYYMVDNDNDIEYSTGSKWTCIRYFQPFRVYEWQDEDEFSFANYHDPEDKFVDYSWNVHYWLPMPLHSQEGNLRLIQTSGFNATHIGYGSWADDTLMIDLFGESGETSTYQLYCGGKGQPKDVSGVSSWAYDLVTKILTLTVIHTGTTTIIISWVTEPVTATIDIAPDTLNLKSKGKWLTAHIELPEDYDVRDIDVSAVRLNGEIQAELYPMDIGDYDTNDITDLMVKFNRQNLIAILSLGEATLTVTGTVKGTPFEGTDTVKVIDARVRRIRVGLNDLTR